MTSDIEEKALQEAAERKAEAKQRKAEAKAKKKALRQAKKAKTNAAKQKAIDAARSTGYSGRLVLLNEESELVKKSNSEALAADVEIRKLKATAKADKKAAKRAARANKKLAKMKAKSAIRATGWTRPVIMMNQESINKKYTKASKKLPIWSIYTSNNTKYKGDGGRKYTFEEASAKAKELELLFDDEFWVDIDEECETSVRNFKAKPKAKTVKAKPKTVRKKATAKSKPVKKKSTKRVR